MKVLCLDDEEKMLGLLKMRLDQIDLITEVHAFTKSKEAFDYLVNNKVDVMFLDINMPDIDGITFAKISKASQPDAKIIFVTGYSEYKEEALAANCSGYLMKPASVDEIKMALQYVSSPNNGERTDNSHDNKNRLRVQCFGNFEVFCDGIPMKFERTKTKELLAYLVDRKGASVSAPEITAVVWEEFDDEVNAQAYFRKCIADLKKTLSEVGMEQLLIADRNAYSVNINTFWCDSYEFDKGNMEVVNYYHGEYMKQYSWAEVRTWNTNNLTK